MADKILYNGKILITAANGCKADDFTEAVAFDGKTIRCVGTKEECMKYADDNTELIDLEGRTVLPGFLDGHTHPSTVAKTKWHSRMPFTHDKDELRENIKEYAKKCKEEGTPYFYGESYFTDTFGDEGPTKEFVDSAISDMPARLQDFGDHACCYNSMALEMLKDENGEVKISSPMGDAIVMKDENGEPTGWVLESGPEGDIGVYEKLGWAPPEDATEDMVAPFLDLLKAEGVGALFDGFTEGEEAIKLFYEMDKAGRLNMYYHGTSIMGEPADLEDAIATVRDWQKKYTTEHISTNAVKFFIDGTNELGDCSSIEPFANDPTGTNYGHQNCTVEEMTHVLVRLNEEKIDLHVHTICDGAFRTMCDAVEKAKEICGDKWCIYVTLAHCELANYEDQKRAAELGIFIDWSCHWSGGYFGDEAITYLGRKRWDTMYNFTPFKKAGGTLGFSSDLFSYQEANRGNPYFGMMIAMTRVDPWVPLDPEKYPGSVRPPIEGKHTLEELIKGYTVNNAKRMRMDDKLGEIKPGKLANVIILNKDIFAVPAEEMNTVEPVKVYFEGEVVTAKNTLPRP